MKIRLTKRFAEFIDGIDLSRAAEGEVLDLSSREAALLILEGWAAPVKDADRGVSVVAPRDQAEEKPRRSRTSAARTPHSRRKG